MIEINLNKLRKGERTIQVKAHPTKQGYVKAHSRVIHVTAAEADTEKEREIMTLVTHKEAAGRTKKWMDEHPERYEDYDKTNNYTVDDYKTINDVLRHDISEEELSTLVVSDQIKSISSFLRDAPKFTGTTFRGMTFSGDTIGYQQLNEFMADIHSSDGFVLKPFTSTSINKDIASGFASTKAGSTAVVMEIRSKTGVALNGVATFKREMEVLFDRGTKFNLVNVEETGRDIYIIIEEA